MPEQLRCALLSMLTLPEHSCMSPPERSTSRFPMPRSTTCSRDGVGRPLAFCRPVRTRMSVGLRRLLVAVVCFPTAPLVSGRLHDCETANASKRAQVRSAVLANSISHLHLMPRGFVWPLCEA